MQHTLREMFGHQAWADAEMWRYIDATPAAQTNDKVLDLLNHIHAVQRFFLSAVQGEPLSRETLTKKMGLAELRESFRSFHEQAETHISKLRDGHLHDPVEVPWFKDFQPRVEECLTQLFMHTQHHRAQVISILSQLGAKMEPVDYILWVMKDREAPKWKARIEA